MKIDYATAIASLNVWHVLNKAENDFRPSIAVKIARLGGELDKCIAEFNKVQNQLIDKYAEYRVIKAAVEGGEEIREKVQETYEEDVKDEKTGEVTKVTKNYHPPRFKIDKANQEAYSKDLQELLDAPCHINVRGKIKEADRGKLVMPAQAGHALSWLFDASDVEGPDDEDMPKGAAPEPTLKTVEAPKA